MGGSQLNAQILFCTVEFLWLTTLLVIVVLLLLLLVLVLSVVALLKKTTTRERSKNIEQGKQRFSEGTGSSSKKRRLVQLSAPNNSVKQKRLEKTKTVNKNKHSHSKHNHRYYNCNCSGEEIFFKKKHRPGALQQLQKTFAHIFFSCSFLCSYFDISLFLSFTAFPVFYLVLISLFLSSFLPSFHFLYS